MAYETIASRAENYGSYTAQNQNSLRRNSQSQINLYLPRDITDAIRQQQSPSQKYPISRLSCLGQYKSDEGKPQCKLPTLPLSEYMGGKRTFPAQPLYSASSLQSMRKSYSKS